MHSKKCKNKVVAKDDKKEYKDLYLPKSRPVLIEVPVMQFVAVEDKGPIITK